MDEVKKVRVLTATPFVPPGVEASLPAAHYDDVLFLKPASKIQILYTDPTDDTSPLPLSSLCRFVKYQFNNPIVPFVKVEGLQYLIRRKKDAEWEELPNLLVVGERSAAEHTYRRLLEKINEFKTFLVTAYSDIAGEQQLEKGIIPEVVEKCYNFDLPLEERILNVISYVFSTILPAPFIRQLPERAFFVEAVYYFVENTEWTVEGVLETLTLLVDRAITFHKTHYELHEKVEREKVRQNQLHSLYIYKRFVEEDIKRLQGSVGGGLYSVEQIRQLYEKKKDELPSDVREYVEEQISYLENTGGLTNVEGAFISRHVLYLLELPWETMATDPPLPIDAAEKVLNERFYGMRRVKERVLDLLYTMERLNLQNLKGRILCFVGPPGVGKTAMSLYLAHVLRRPLQKIHLGGISDETEIRGHRRTYVGATAGRIIEAIKRAGVKNPIIVLEEIDKLTHGGIKGDPIAALMEVLDPEQNHSFIDHYVDFPFDLSKVFFIATANIEEDIHPTLRDRLEVVHLRPYFLPEKVAITKDFLLPKVCEDLGIGVNEVKFPEKNIRWFVEHYSFGGGVRELERNLRLIIERHLRRHPHRQITPELIKSYLMSPPERKLRKLETPMVGVAPLLVVTSSGEGDVEFVQVSRASKVKKENNVYSGRLGEVPKEVIEVALSLLARHGIEIDHPVHVHQTSHSVKKEGSSGGVSTFCALYSYATGRPIPTNWAFTGEIDLLGFVHPVGGIDAKLVAAEQAGYTCVFLPIGNKEDVELMDFSVNIEIKYVKTVDEILEHLKGG